MSEVNANMMRLLNHCRQLTGNVYDINAHMLKADGGENTYRLELGDREISPRLRMTAFVLWLEGFKSGILTGKGDRDGY